jgi:hypothetical protein
LESADGQYWIVFVVLVHKGPQMSEQCTSHFKTLDTGEATLNEFCPENPPVWSELRTFTVIWSLLLGACELIDISVYKRKIKCSDC